MLHYTVHIGVEPGNVPPDIIGGMLQSRFMTGQEITAYDPETGTKWQGKIGGAKIVYVAHQVQKYEANEEKPCESP